MQGTTNAHLERCIKSLRSKLRRVPVYDRTAHYQMAVRHVGSALLLLDSNETAAAEHHQRAIFHAHYVISTIGRN